MSKDFCVIVFSHADNSEKEEILFNSLISIKKLNLKVILTSHIPVSERNQILSDYFIKDDNNLILSEADIINNSSDVVNNLYNTTDYFGGFRFETSVYKKSYQAGVFNLCISSFKLAKNIGFKNAILWEYDYILGNKSSEFINSNLDRMKNEKLESISFQSKILIFNTDIIQTEIECCYSIPVILNVNRFLSLAPNRFIENAKEYVDISMLMIMEQWMKKNIINNCNPRIEYGYDKYSDYLPDTITAQVDYQSTNYLFLGLRSGIYFSDRGCIASHNNTSKNHLTSDIIIYDLKNKSILFNNKFDLPPNIWRYNNLGENIFNIFKSESGCRVTETIEDVNSGKVDTFEYVINKSNIDFVSKLKKYSI